MSYLLLSHWHAESHHQWNKGIHPPLEEEQQNDLTVYSGRRDEDLGKIIKYIKVI